VLELRPPVAVNKGTAALALAEALEIPRHGATVLFLGDDRTDEDAFTILRREFAGAVTVRVGSVPEGETTAAELGLPTPAAVERFLNELARL